MLDKELAEQETAKVVEPRQVGIDESHDLREEGVEADVVGELVAKVLLLLG